MKNNEQKNRLKNYLVLQAQRPAISSVLRVIRPLTSWISVFSEALPASTASRSLVDLL